MEDKAEQPALSLKDMFPGTSVERVQELMASEAYAQRKAAQDKAREGKQGYAPDVTAEINR